MTLPSRENFICANCVIGVTFQRHEGPEVECRLMPVCQWKEINSYCAQGQWHFEDSRGALLPYFFGEWLPDPKA